MSSKEQARGIEKANSKQRPPKTTTGNLNILAEQSHPAAVIQRAERDPGSLTPSDVWHLQRAIGNQAVGLILAGAGLRRAVQKKENTTGLPENLKAGVESLSGMSMGDVKVHYNSSEPARLDALAYTQGTDIHLGPGQERHLPHEAWHVVQQKQGRVRPTLQAKAVALNDDERLEKEADAAGAKASEVGRAEQALTVSGLRDGLSQREGATKGGSEALSGGEPYARIVSPSPRSVSQAAVPGVVQAKFANTGAVAAPAWGYGWQAKEYYGVEIQDWNSVMEHAGAHDLKVYVSKGEIAVPILNGGPGPDNAFYGLFTNGAFTGYVSQNGQQVLSPQSVPGAGGAFHNIPTAHVDIVEELINRFSLTSVTSEEAKTTSDYIVTYKGTNNRIDRQGPSRNNTHAKFAVQIGAATYAGIEMEAERDFDINMVREAFQQSIQDGTYRRLHYA